MKNKTKKEIFQIATQEAEENIVNGNTDILDLYLDAHRQIHYYQTLLTVYHEKALEEFEKSHTGNKMNVDGIKISKGETGVGYDFSKCGHIDLFNLENEEKSIKNKIAEVKNTIKTLKERQTIVNDSGEIFTVTPPIKTSTTIAT